MGLKGRVRTPTTIGGKKIRKKTLGSRKTEKAEEAKPGSKTFDPIQPIATVAIPLHRPKNVPKLVLARKKKSEEILAKHGIPVLCHLPFVGGGSLKDPQSVRNRIVILQHVNFLGYFDKNERKASAKQFVKDLKTKHHIWSDVSPEEREFFANPNKTTGFTSDSAQFRCEAIWVLYWAFNMVSKDIGFPREMCKLSNLDCDMLPMFMHPMNMRQFRKYAVESTGNPKAGTLQSLKTIEDKEDITYRAHWAYRNKLIVGPYTREELGKELIAREWHQTLGWLTCPAAWDDIELST